MQRPPTPLGESLFGADRGRRIVLRGLVLTVLTLVPAFLLWRSGDPVWQTVLLTSIAFAKLAGRSRCGPRPGRSAGWGCSATPRWWVRSP